MTNDRKNFQNAFHQLALKKHVEYAVDLARHENLSDPKKRFTDLLTEWNWFTAKTLSQCLSEHSKSKLNSK